MKRTTDFCDLRKAKDAVQGELEIVDRVDLSPRL